MCVRVMQFRQLVSTQFGKRTTTTQQKNESQNEQIANAVNEQLNIDLHTEADQ